VVHVGVSAQPRCPSSNQTATDNEANFCSLFLRTVLFLVGVHHQRSAPHCPWQNGRVERFFATFKELALPRLADLRAWQTEPESFQDEIDTFRLWFNHVRPHQHLDGRTPAEAWNGLESIGDRKRRKPRFFSEWEGILAGFW
jgi:transposase InsO family protein